MRCPSVHMIALVTLLAAAGITPSAAQPAPQPSSTSESRAAASPAAQAEPSARHKALIDSYCVRCHNARLKTAGLALDSIDMTTPGADAALWEKVVRKLRSGSMPPASAPRPDQAATTAL